MISADTGAKKVPKIESSYELPMVDVSYLIVYEAPVQLPNGTVPLFMGTLSDNTFVPKGTIIYLSILKPLYVDPDVDRKWVWWNSIVTNS